MSQRLVSASDWNSKRNFLNTLYNDLNSKLITSVASGASVSPDVRPLLQGGSPVSRTVSAYDLIRYVEYSDSDGLVTKYNFLRKYDSCRRRTSSKVWEYGKVVCSDSLTGRRDSSFPSDTPAYINPPAAYDQIKDIVPNRDILEIIYDGVNIHRDTVLNVPAGQEYVVIDECHSECHSSCHSSCHRNRR